MKCFKCGMTLEPHPEIEAWIKDGMRFSTYGGYGSRAFDSISRAVEICVCDTCFLAAASDGIIETKELVEPMVHATWRYRTWDPTEQD